MTDRAAPSSIDNSLAVAAARRPAGQRLPYLCALISIVPVYASVQSVTGQEMLAVTLAAVAAIVAFMGCRLVQLRGRFTLAIFVIGLPLLIALGFTAVRHLRPFIERQRSISLLRDGGIEFRAQRPNRAGEWKRDRSGNMLPTWIANRIGPDCLSELTSVSGDLAQFQQLPASAIVRTHVTRVRLHRFNDYQPVSNDLVDWLNGLTSPRISIQLTHYSDKDGDALARLNHEYVLSVDVDRDTGDLSKLKSATHLSLIGNVLSDRQAGQLRSLGTTTVLNLEGFHLSPDLIEKLNDSAQEDLLRIGFRYSTCDLPTLRAVSDISNRSVSLDQVSLPKSFNLDSKSQLDTRGKSLLLLDASPSISGVRRLVNLFQCERLLIEMNATDEEIATLWDAPVLRSIEVWHPDSQGRLRRFERPNAAVPN